MALTWLERQEGVEDHRHERLEVHHTVGWRTDKKRAEAYCRQVLLKLDASVRRHQRVSNLAVAFAVIPGEDEETNPGIYGKALAQWLAGQLRAAGFSPGEVIAEDFGWWVPVEAGPMARVRLHRGRGDGSALGQG